MRAISRPTIAYGLAALLALGELAILATAMQPRVSDTYRARYIAGTSNCWLTGVSGEITLGERIPATGKEISHLLRCGWLAPEPYGTWSTGEEVKLRFALPSGRPALFLDLGLAPFGADKGHVQQVQVSAADTTLASFTLDRQLIVARRIFIPASLPLDANGHLEVDLSIPTAISPRQLGISDEGQRLGIRLISLKLAPAP